MVGGKYSIPDGASSSVTITDLMRMILACAIIRRSKTLGCHHPKCARQKKILQPKISDHVRDVETKTHGWNIEPFETRLSNAERIVSGANAAEVNIDPQTVNVITQLRRSHRAQVLAAGIRDQRDFVWSFLVPDRKIKNQVLGRSKSLQRGLTGVRWVLPAGH